MNRVRLSLITLATLLILPVSAWAVCPALNEVADGSGVCTPAFSDPHHILTEFNPLIHDVAPYTQVMNRDAELVGGVIPPGKTIHACAPPYRLNIDQGKCLFERDFHMCSGSVAGSKASEVSSQITGMTADDRFQNTVNKKLAACLNEFGQTASAVKFDCIENSKTIYQNFDQLWTSADDSIDGGQLNALVLANSAGNYLSGFYELKGTRCAEFSEFAGDIQPGKVNEVGKPELFQTLGKPPIELPSSAAYSALHSKMISKGLRVPETIAEKRRCPILVRAATLVQCPQNPVMPATQRNIDVRFPPDTGAIVHRRCAIASSVQVRVKLEQVWEIQNMPKMATEDTVTDPKNASAISIDRIIANKYGNQCPPGTRRQGDSCVY